MSDLDNSNLTNEEETSGFSASEPDNKSFSADKGSTANATGNIDWGQTNKFVKPPKKTPLWPFLLVGAFVCLGLVIILAVSATRCNRQEKVQNYQYATHFKGYENNHTQEIAYDKKVVVEVNNDGKHCDKMNPGNPNNCKPMGNCDNEHGKPMGKCCSENGKPMDKCCKDSHKPMDKYHVYNCKPGAKCDPNGKCNPAGKCDPNGKCDPKSCKPSDDKSINSHYEIQNCKNVKIKVVNNNSSNNVVTTVSKPLRTAPKQMLPIPKPVKKIISPKPGKPALQDNEKGLYVLQVYSSLSKEEADSKLDEYKNKGAEKVWVSTYTHSNVIWYRVRIGDFISKGAADAKAKELGVTNYWVDKIR